MDGTLQRPESSSMQLVALHHQNSSLRPSTCAEGDAKDFWRGGGLRPGDREIAPESTGTLTPDVDHAWATSQIRGRTKKDYRRCYCAVAWIAIIFIVLGAIIAVVTVKPSKSATKHFVGVATFNDYSTQAGTVCGPKTASKPSYFGAAAGDISPDISGGLCEGTIDMSICTNGKPGNTYEGPSCPKTNCGTCYKVTSLGPYGTVDPSNKTSSSSKLSPAPGARSITVQIIDSCPASNAFNFCKNQTGVPADERCGDPSTNSLDLDQSAYLALTGVPFGNGLPNLDLEIESVSC